MSLICSKSKSSFLRRWCDTDIAAGGEARVDDCFDVIAVHELH
jgi:hypothetical protein